MADDDHRPEQAGEALLKSIHDVARAMGRVEGQNELILREQARASESRRDQYEAIEQIRADARDVKALLSKTDERVTRMEPDVEKMKGFRAQVALAVIAVTTVVTGAINLLWIGVTHLSEIKNALREFLR